MATTGDMKVSEGLGKNVAVYIFSEDGEPKIIQRIHISDSVGADALGLLDVSPDALSLLGRLKTIGDNTGAAQAIAQTSEGVSNRVAAGKTIVVPVTLTLDTSAYASGDLLADTQPIAAATRVNDFGGILQSLVVVDQDDTAGFAFDVYILDANVSFGTENAAPSISDANAVKILGIISVSAGDYKDLGGVKVACYSGLGIPVVPATGTQIVYFAVVNGTGAPTYTAGGLVFNFGILQD